MLDYPGMRSRRQEWDWPPERRRRRYDGPFPPATDRASKAEGLTRAVDIYWKIVWTTLTMVLAAIYGVVVAACIWLLVQIFNL
jgi:hypothetical protein